MSECAPALSADVFSTAEPAETGDVPSDEAPSKNSTEPPGLPAPGGDDWLGRGRDYIWRTGAGSVSATGSLDTTVKIDAIYSLDLGDRAFAAGGRRRAAGWPAALARRRRSAAATADRQSARVLENALVRRPADQNALGPAPGAGGFPPGSGPARCCIIGQRWRAQTSQACSSASTVSYWYTARAASSQPSW